jgi:hypothetical protein
LRRSQDFKGADAIAHHQGLGTGGVELATESRSKLYQRIGLEDALKENAVAIL